ncbi:mannose-6-phosphate isomerase, class I [Microbacterium sp. MYb62]|nr:mannose-6-phosphate isomerase, class I [Microbacterium sp. MYb62]PRB15126.1 mannose-6-phosphate isomerase, class I [Microbacterium sp. MYb62]
MLLSLTNTPRDYAWGSDTLLAALEGRTPTGVPEAEVWFGDHPGDPADVVEGGTLDQITGGTLPYLLKLLAAGRPLSIQVHPTIEQARAGWARESGLAADDPQRNYRDDNHKPELLVALSERFESLSGLRPVRDSLALLETLDDTEGVGELRARLSADGDALRDVIGWVLGGTAQRAVDEIIAAVVDAARSDVGEWRTTLRAIAGVAQTYPGDPGVVVALLMNHVVLHRGEGVFLRAGLLHAYLSGLGVEIMAASDNVLRGGLTPKRIDVPELLAILDTTPGEVPVLRPSRDEAVTPYPVPVPDFSLRRIVVIDGAPVTCEVTGPTMVLATGGEVSVATTGGEAIAVAIGTAAFVGADEPSFTVAGAGEVFVAAPGR